MHIYLLTHPVHSTTPPLPLKTHALQKPAFLNPNNLLIKNFNKLNILPKPKKPHSWNIKPEDDIITC